MDKLRTNKDARYYRNLLFKNEYRQAGIVRDLKQLQNAQMRTNSILSTHQVKLQSIRILLILNLLATIYSFKDTVCLTDINDYTDTVLHMWKGYWEQIRAIYEAYTGGEDGEGSVRPDWNEQILLQANDTWSC